METISLKSGLETTDFYNRIQCSRLDFVFPITASISSSTQYNALFSMNCGYIVVINISMRNTRHLEGEGKHIRSEVVLMISSPGKGEAGHSAP